MRRHHYAIAVAVVLFIGYGAKLLLFPTPTARADVPGVSLDVMKMTIEHPNSGKHPAQEMTDMTFVFSSDN